MDGIDFVRSLPNLRRLLLRFHLRRPLPQESMLSFDVQGFVMSFFQLNPNLEETNFTIHLKRLRDTSSTNLIRLHYVGRIHINATFDTTFRRTDLEINTQTRSGSQIIPTGC